jgi:hypothetical protein
MKRNAAHFLILFLSLIASAAHAQSAPSNNELGLVIGATLTPSVGLQSVQPNLLQLNPSLTLGAEYDRRLFGHHTAVSVGLDFFASPNDVHASQPPSNVSPEYAFLFLTPHVRVKFNAEGTLQPWLLFGGGYADFAPAQPRSGGVNVAGTGNSSTFQFGGGVDTKPLVHLKHLPLLGTLPIGARAEVRDFYSGQPDYGVATTGSRQNNVLLTGGLVLHF